MSDLFYRVEEVQQIMGIGRAKAYNIMRKLNKELEKQGYITVAGRCNKAYFDAKIDWKKDKNEQTA